MSILFDEIAFGPVKSRRFGLSLGINLLPLDNKICNFDCIYCECGWTNLKGVTNKFIPKKDILSAIDTRLAELKEKGIKPDAITFAGNGEPTMHPDFAKIMDGTIVLRNKYFPEVKLVVLSNATLIGNKDVFDALQKTDIKVLKLDAGSDELFRLIDQPRSSKSIDWYIEKLKSFKGELYLQTIFLTGTHRNKNVDNTTEDEVNKWLGHIKEIKPAHVMIYTIDREPPSSTIHKAKPAVLEKICRQVNESGFSAKVYS